MTTNEIIAHRIPTIVQVGNMRGELGTIPLPFERTFLLDEYKVLQKFYSGSKPADLSIPIGSPLSVRKMSGASIFSKGSIIAESAQYSFSVSIESNVLPALIEAGFELIGKLNSVSLDRKILPDFSVAYFRHLSIEINMKD